MGNWGIRVSKPGFDVGTCSDYDLVMSSSFNALKTKFVGTAAGTIAHGLSYTPIFMCCQTFGSGTTGFMGHFVNPGIVGVNSTNIEVSGTIRYYLFYQQAV